MEAMRGAPLWAAMVLVAAVLARAAPLRAEDPAQMAEARALFDAARKRMAAGDWAEAAMRLEESLTHVHGKGTLFQLAVCYEKLGRFSSAWSLFEEVARAAERSGEGERARIARERAAAVAPRVSRLTIEVLEVPPPQDMRLSRDGREVVAGDWGAPLPVDAGKVHIEARATGRATWESDVDVKPGASLAVRIPPLAAIPAVVPHVDLAAAAPSAPAVPPPPSVAPVEHRSRLGAQRTVALGIAGAGLAGLVVGTVYGLRSNGEYGDSRAYCGADGACRDARGVSLRADAFHDGSASTVAFIAGGALVASAVALWLLVPTAAPARTGLTITPSPTGIAGTW
jgi:hypothetical protein